MNEGKQLTRKETLTLNNNIFLVQSKQSGELTAASSYLNSPNNNLRKLETSSKVRNEFSKNALKVVNSNFEKLVNEQLENQRNFVGSLSSSPRQKA